MQVFSTYYKFNQQFSVPAKEAFDWCTNYQPGDLALMGEEGNRRINKLTSDTVILEERVVQDDKRVTKVKLVKLNRSTYSWHNIQLKGPNRYSEFIYEIVSEGRRSSRLFFTGLLLVYATKRISQQRLWRIANMEREYDSKAWKRLASAMAKELRKA
jgi:hypothetical protein